MNVVLNGFCRRASAPMTRSHGGGGICSCVAQTVHEFSNGKKGGEVASRFENHRTNGTLTRSLAGRVPLSRRTNERYLDAISCWARSVIQIFPRNATLGRSEHILMNNYPLSKKNKRRDKKVRADDVEQKSIDAPPHAHPAARLKH